MEMLRRIKGVTLRDRIKSVNIRKERENYAGHMQRMEENNEVKPIVDMAVP